MKDKRTLSRVNRERITRLSIGLCIFVLMSFLPFWQPPMLEQLNKEIYDVFLRWQSGGTPSPAPAIVNIDEDSLQEFGQWPWPRHLLGKLVKELNENNAAAIGLDIILAEPDNTSLKNIQNSFKHHFNIELPFEQIPSAYVDNDKIFAHIVQQSRVVCGTFVRFEGKERSIPKDLPYHEGITDKNPDSSQNLRRFLLTGKDITLPLPELMRVAPLGMVNATPDSDGILRSIPLVAQVGDRTLIALSVRTLMRAYGMQDIMLVRGKKYLQSLRLGTKHIIPISREGLFTIPFRGKSGTYPTFSAADILNKKVPPEEIAGRIIFVGSSAPGLMDIRTTPFDAAFPGVESHAAIVDAILKNRFIQIPQDEVSGQFLCIIIFGALCTLIFSLSPAIVYLPLLLTFVTASMWASWSIFTRGFFFSPLYVMLTISALALTLLGVRFWQESKQRRTLRHAFSRYIASDMVERIIDKGDVVLSGEARQLTIMFTDIRGFTNISEKLNPAQVVEMLNAYFTPMTSIIHAHQGTMDKFIGDAIMAFWNAPLHIKNHELHAINSALEMHNALQLINKDFLEQYGVTVHIGVGVHTGEVYVGNMGSAELLDYTCIGDTVNLTSRLEALCPVYGVDIITSGETASRCTEITEAEDEIPFFLLLDIIQVKGKSEPVEILTPLSQEEAKLRHEEIKDFLFARSLYHAGKFAQAHTAFSVLHYDFPNTVLYEFYTKRCEFLQKKPPENWNGVWVYMRK